LEFGIDMWVAVKLFGYWLP